MLIRPTWTHGNRRPVLRRAQWGIVVGATDIFDGLVSLLSLGQFASDASLNAAFRLTVAESRRYQAQQEKEVVR